MKEEKIVMSYEELYNKLTKIPDLEDRALLCTIYLTLARVGEITGHRHTHENYLRLGDVKIIGSFLEITIQIEKSGRKRKRTPVINLNNEMERNLAMPLLEYCEKRLQEEELIHRMKNNPEPLKVEHIKVFPFLEQTARRKFLRYFGYDYYQNIHMLRHLRSHHLIKNFGFDILHLQQIGGWKDIKTPSEYYAHLDTSMIKKKFESYDNITNS